MNLRKPLQTGHIVKVEYVDNSVSNDSMHLHDYQVNIIKHYPYQTVTTPTGGSAPRLRPVGFVKTCYLPMTYTQNQKTLFHIASSRDYTAGASGGNLHRADKPGAPIARLNGVMDKSVERLFGLDPCTKGLGKSYPALCPVHGGMGTGDCVGGQLPAVDMLSL